MTKINKEGWEIKKLGEVTDFSRGLTYSGKDEVTTSSNVVLRSNNITLESQSLNLDELKYINDSIVIPAEKKLAKDTIFMCMSNGSMKHIGKVAYIDKDYDYAFGGFMGLMRPKAEVICPKYLYFYFCSPLFKLVLAKIANGANINNIKFSDINQEKILLPPLPIQQRIVEELDEINAIISAKKQQLSKLDELAQSIFYNMFSPENCEYKALGKVVKVQSGQVSPKYEPYCNMIHVGPANIESGTGRLTNLRTAKEENLISGKYLFDGSMVLYSKIRPNLNKVTIADFEGICSADMYPLIPSECIEKNFLLYVLKQKDFLTYAINNSGRANIPKINREALLAYEMPVPSLSLQETFATRVSAIEEEKAVIAASIEKMQTLLDARMQEYFG